MSLKPDERSTVAEQGNSSKPSHSPIPKPATDWEQPDFEEFDLCMEVTAYVQLWH